jgi:hypothetical protein
MLSGLKSLLNNIFYLWMAILLITILLVPQVADWGSAWSCVGGYDLSKLPLVFVIAIIFFVGIELFTTYQKKK